MKLERKVRLCSAAAAVLIAAIALTGCGGSKSTASSAAASSVAASTAAATNNSCGEGVTWALADGTLTISGTGRMTNFTKDAPAPWADQADQITTVEVEGTVTSVGATAFKDCTALTTVNIADGVEYIEAGAFNGCTALTEVNIPPERGLHQDRRIQGLQRPDQRDHPRQLPSGHERVPRYRGGQLRRGLSPIRNFKPKEV